MFFARFLTFSSILLALLTFSCSVRMPVEEKISSATSNESTTELSSSEKKDTVSVLLLADSLHTGLAFPYDWLIENGYNAPEGLTFEKGPLRYVVMSWGDRTAYVQRRWLTPFEVFHALFMPSPSVSEIIPVSWKIEEVCSQQRIYSGQIARTRGVELAKFLNASTTMNAKGKPSIVMESAWGNGYLLDCPYSYFFPRICNVWTGQCLEACGLEINIRQAIFANGIIEQCESQGFKKIHSGVKGYGRTPQKNNSSP